MPRSVWSVWGVLGPDFCLEVVFAVRRASRVSEPAVISRAPWKAPGGFSRVSEMGGVVSAAIPRKKRPKLSPCAVSKQDDKSQDVVGVRSSLTYMRHNRQNVVCFLPFSKQLR